MSSVPEALAARMLGLHVYGMSLITNLGAGLSDEVLTHEDVKEVANNLSEAVQELVSQIIKKVDIEHLSKIEPWGTVHEDFEMVQHQEKYCTWADIEKHKFDGVKRCLVYSDNKFGITKSGSSIIVSCPKTIGMFEATLVLGVC